MRLASVLIWAAAAAGCASASRGGEEAAIVPQPHKKVARAGLVDPGRKIPAERDGVRIEHTGAIMFVCANTEKHEEKEVVLSLCPECKEVNYFYVDLGKEQFACFACAKPYDNANLKCPECGKPPRRARMKNKPKAAQ